VTILTNAEIAHDSTLPMINTCLIEKINVEILAVTHGAHEIKKALVMIEFEK
jgi:hypothetical protein